MTTTQLPADAPSALDRVRIFGKSPVSAWLKISRVVWTRCPASWTASAVGREYGHFVHRLIRSRAGRQQYFGTFFFRNRPQLAVISRLIDGIASGSALKAAFLGCSNGAEVYSVLWTIRRQRPDLRVTAQAVDISSDILSVARRGVYPLAPCGVVGQPVFARTREEDLRAMFDVDRAAGTATLKSWLKEGIAWHEADAASPTLRDVIGAQDLVIANNFLCHMQSPAAERCLRSVARLVKPGGVLVVSGVDVDVRARVAADLGWRPVLDLLEEVHNGDPMVRNDWPWKYWGLEPLDRARPDWRVRYASVFRLPPAAAERRNGPRLVQTARNP
jgi:SAM-dependent methyltransferase